MARALTRRESKELTRRRLIDGAIEILRTDGVAAATTGRIADMAGIKQPSFYGHFADRDECLQAVAERIGGIVLERLRDNRRSIDPRDLRATVRRGLDSTLQAFLVEPALTRLFLRYRADDESALGRTFLDQIARAHAELQKDVRLLGVAATPAEAEVFAELMISGTLGLVEGLLDGRVSDRAVAVDRLVDIVCAVLGAAFERKD